MVRPPAVAGSFYPADPADLAQAVDALLPTSAPDQPPPKAIIVPHAGYEYSGPVAGAAYSLLTPDVDAMRVVLVGPAHFHPLEGVAVSGADALATPLGPVEVDDEARTAVLVLSVVQRDDAPHEPEHSLEVQLPILQRLLGPFRILPLVTGRAVAPADLAAVLDAVWGGTETVVVCSSDLSHYHDHDTATALDRRTASAVVDRDVEGIGSRDACGAVAIRGLLEAARRRDLPVRLLDLRTSHDAGGPRDRVVGYGAFAVG